ncbi:M35 family metallo-endopeptidase [Marivita sp.]|uniref:M35 family metallo-endopeptidase n=1 Tax=Marivita sp. TaxID=2003365 RepID=UPI003F726FCB
MYKFEECYKASRDELKKSSAFEKLPSATKCIDLSMVFPTEGPKRTHYSALTQLRGTLSSSAKTSKQSEGELLVAACGAATDSATDTIVKGLNDEVAALKMARHMYLVHMRGGQDVWVFSPPVHYTEWLQDEFKGLGNKGLATWASQTDEVYSKADKKAMGEATQLALSWTMKCISKLGSPDDATNTVIKRWFCASAATEDEVKTLATKLLRGLSKIATVLNSGMLVLSDEPIDRNSGGWKDYAFVYKSEKMNVIYIQKATLSAALGNKMWDAALTIVHELSHRELGTDDHRYADDGPLSPASATGLTKEQALDNADTWGFFAADLNGAISSGVRKTASGLAA